MTSKIELSHELFILLHKRTFLVMLFLVLNIIPQYKSLSLLHFLLCDETSSFGYL